VSGRKHASSLGFPTINIEYERGSVLPKLSIYAGVLRHGGKEYRGAICLAPAKEMSRPKLEIFCFDQVPAVPDDEVECIFLGEVGDLFEGNDEAMKRKIAEDIEKTRGFFLRNNKNG